MRRYSHILCPDGKSRCRAKKKCVNELGDCTAYQEVGNRGISFLLENEQCHVNSNGEKKEEKRCTHLNGEVVAKTRTKDKVH